MSHLSIAARADHARRARGGRRTPPARLACCAAVMIGLSACSGSTHPSGDAPASGQVTTESDGTQVIALSETEQYRFVPEEPHVKPGKVRIDMTNSSKSATHSLAFKPGGPSDEIPFINPGEKKSISFTISTPGEYRFFCTFHEGLGQRGLLVVEPA